MIISVDDNAINSPADMLNLLENYSIGDTVQLKLIRTENQVIM